MLINGSLQNSGRSGCLSRNDNLTLSNNLFSQQHARSGASYVLLEFMREDGAYHTAFFGLNCTDRYVIIQGTFANKTFIIVNEILCIKYDCLESLEATVR